MMKNYEVEMAVYNDSGCLEYWVSEVVPDFVAGDSALDALYTARQYTGLHY